MHLLHKFPALMQLLILISIKKSIFVSMTDALIQSLVATRKASKMTQADLAEQAGLSRMAVQRTETGDVDPRYSTVAEMARVLGLQMLAVPADLVPALQAFIQSGGKFLGQPTGADAPPSVVEAMAAEQTAKYKAR